MEDKATIINVVSMEDIHKLAATHKKHVIVKCWATWCVPCKNFAPIIESVAKQFADTVTFVALNVEEDKDICNEFDIRSIPTLLMFDADKHIATLSGAVSEDKVVAWIQSHLNIQQ